VELAVPSVAWAVIAHEACASAVSQQAFMTASIPTPGVCRSPRPSTRRQPKCTAGPPRMDHVRAYIGFSYIKYSRTSFIPFFYITEVLNLRPCSGRPSWAARRPKQP
jgi:hypothetical protein